MKKYLLKLYLFALFCGISIHHYSQVSNSALSPSDQAQSTRKYAETPVNRSIGAPQISFPVAQLQAKEMLCPFPSSMMPQAEKLTN